jgi:hypothetical protein
MMETHGMTQNKMTEVLEDIKKRGKSCKKSKRKYFGKIEDFSSVHLYKTETMLEDCFFSLQLQFQSLCSWHLQVQPPLLGCSHLLKAVFINFRNIYESKDYGQ